MAKLQVTDSEPHLCWVCGAEIPRRSNEAYYEWRRRTVCPGVDGKLSACTRKAMGRKKIDGSELDNAQVTDETCIPPVCKACGKALPRMPGERIFAWLRRDVCPGSNECLVKVAALTPPPKKMFGKVLLDLSKPPVCRICGKLLSRRDGEATYRWMRRVVCDGVDGQKSDCHRKAIGRGPLDAGIRSSALTALTSNTVPQVPVCGTCGKEIPRKPGERVYKWMRQVTCRGDGIQPSDCELQSTGLTTTQDNPRGITVDSSYSKVNKLLQWGSRHHTIRPTFQLETTLADRMRVEFPEYDRAQEIFMKTGAITDEEQFVIDRYCHLVDSLRSGMTYQPARSLSRDEIDSLLAQGKISYSRTASAESQGMTGPTGPVCRQAQTRKMAEPIHQRKEAKPSAVAISTYDHYG